MDQELSAAFASLSGQMSDVGRDARSAAELSRDNAREIALIKGDVANIKKHVFGSDPPPPPGAPSRAPGAAPRPTPRRVDLNGGDLAPDEGKPAPIVARVSETEADVDGLHGQVIALNSKFEDLSKQQVQLLDLQKKQMKAQGVSAGGAEEANIPAWRGFLTFVTSREGVKFVLHLATLAGVAYGGFYAAMHGAPPGPWHPPTAPTHELPAPASSESGH